jgi:hypothetical protein
LDIYYIHVFKKATLGPSGHVSVIQEEWAKPLQKGDLQAARVKG